MKPRAGDVGAAGEATRSLARWAEGAAAAGERLWTLIYGDLRRIARRHLSRERGGHTLDPTGLVHEAWMRIGAEHESGSERWRRIRT